MNEPDSQQVHNERLLMTAINLLEEYREGLKQNQFDVVVEGEDFTQLADFFQYIRDIDSAVNTLKVVAFTGDLPYVVDDQPSWREKAGE